MSLKKKLVFATFHKNELSQQMGHFSLPSSIVLRPPSSTHTLAPRPTAPAQGGVPGAPPRCCPVCPGSEGGRCSKSLCRLLIWNPDARTPESATTLDGVQLLCLQFAAGLPVCPPALTAPTACTLLWAELGLPCHSARPMDP